MGRDGLAKGGMHARRDGTGLERLGWQWAAQVNQAASGVSAHTLAVSRTAPHPEERGSEALRAGRERGPFKSPVPRAAAGWGALPALRLPRQGAWPRGGAPGRARPLRFIFPPRPRPPLQHRPMGAALAVARGAGLPGAG